MSSVTRFTLLGIMALFILLGVSFAGVVACGLRKYKFQEHERLVAMWDGLKSRKIDDFMPKPGAK